MKYICFLFCVAILHAEEAFFRIHINKMQSDKWHFVTFDGGGVLVPLKILEDYNINLDLLKGSVTKTQRVDLKKVATSLKINEDDFTIEAQLDLKYFKTHKLAVDADKSIGFTKEGKGVFFNHTSTLLNTEKGRQQFGSIVEGNAYMPNGSFFSGLYVSVNQMGQGIMLKRMDTFWSDDFGEQTFNIGDVTTHGSSLLGGTRLGGVQYGSMFNARTGFVTYYQPSVQGSAAVPTTIDIYANNLRILHEEVKAGQYNITNIPVVSGDGTLIVETTDITGKKSTIELPYFLSPTLLKETLSEYYVEAGFRREHYLKNNFDYKDMAASGFYRYGLMQHWTVGMISQVMKNLINTEISHTFQIPYVGLLTLSSALSKSNLGTGQGFGLNYSKSVGNVNFGFDVNAKRGKFPNIATWPKYLEPQINYTTFIGAPVGENSSLSLSYANTSESTGKKFKSYSASYRTLLAKGLSLSLTGLRSFSYSSDTKENDTRILFNLIYNFDGGKSVSLSHDYAKKKKDSTTDLGFNENYPGGSYAARLLYGNNSLNYNARVTKITEVGDIDLQLLGKLRQKEKSTHSQSINFSNGLGFIEDQTFVSRRVTDSMALVSVSGLPNIRIYNENRLVGKTNKDGKLIVPDISPFQKHTIRVEEKDLPLDTVVPIKEKTIISPEYSAVLVDFDIKTFKTASFIFKDQDGFVPAGSKVKFDGLKKEFIVGFDGVVFANNYDLATHKGVVETAVTTCSFNSKKKEITVTCKDPEEAKHADEDQDKKEA